MFSLELSTYIPPPFCNKMLINFPLRMQHTSSTEQMIHIVTIKLITNDFFFSLCMSFTPETCLLYMQFEWMSFGTTSTTSLQVIHQFHTPHRCVGDHINVILFGSSRKDCGPEAILLDMGRPSSEDPYNKRGNNILDRKSPVVEHEWVIIHHRKLHFYILISGEIHW